ERPGRAGGAPNVGGLEERPGRAGALRTLGGLGGHFGAPMSLEDERRSPMFRDVVTDEKDLRALLGTPSEVALKKQIAALDGHCRALIAHSPFMLLATAGADGRCDVSPKGDPPGFVHVLDDTHLVIPDRPGNKRL